MHDHIRADLTRFLPRVLSRSTADTRPLGDGLNAPDNNDRPDYYLELQNAHEPAGDEAVFSLHQAQAAATRIAQVLRNGTPQPGLLAFDRDRVQRTLD